MEGVNLKFENPIGDAITRVRFSPRSNNLLISSWDSSLRLYDVDSSVLRLEAPTEAALFDCCFQNEKVAFTADSDCLLRRYDLHSGVHDVMGNHDDLATCVEYSDETCQVITAGWDKKIMSWDARMAKALGYSKVLAAEVDSMSLSGLNLMVAVGASVNLYDLRNLDKPFQAKESCMNNRIRCLRPTPNSTGFAVGSVDGRVALEFPFSSNSVDMGYIFRCHPKLKDSRYHLVSVNDIVFNPFVCSIFFTGDNEGYVTTWDARGRRRLFEVFLFESDRKLET